MKIEGVQSHQQIHNQQIVHKEKIKPNTTKFEELLNETETEAPTGKDKKINEMIDNIEKLKSILDHDLTVDNLNEYKEAVKSFLSYYTTNELKMENTYARDKRGYEQKLQVIKSVDSRLNDLTENMLETHQGHLETLKSIGEIQGLIVNIFV
jgi:hypothetical protein